MQQIFKIYSGKQKLNKEHKLAESNPSLDRQADDSGLAQQSGLLVVLVAKMDVAETSSGTSASCLDRGKRG